MSKTKLSVSFSKKYLSTYTYLKSRENASLYICTLVDIDISKNYESNNFESQVELIVERVLKDKQLTCSNSDKLPEYTSNKTTNEDVDLILNLF